MHNHVANCGRKALLKQIFSVFLIFTLYFNSFNSAYASTSLGGWTITSQIAQGASTLYNATKSGIENGVNIIKTSTAKITPSASNVSKILRGGAYGYAISVAVEQILGFTVDWILDPANNQIKYYVDGQPQWYSNDTGQHYTSRDAACHASMNYRFGRTYTITSYTSEGNFHYCYFNLNGSQGYVTVEMKPTAQEERKIPLDAVSTQVISNAESHPDEQKKAGAQSATTAAAQDMLANDAATQSDVETQLNANAKTQTSEQATGNTKPNEANPEVTDISLSFPAFCGWAPSVCQAANVVINFPNTLTNWWTTATTSISDAWTWTKSQYEAAVTSISDFFKNEPDQTDNTDLPVQEIPIPQLQTDAFSATPGCPEPIPIQIKIGVEGTAHISYEPICQFAEKWSFIAPLIGFLSGAMIIVGVGRKGEDSEI